MSQDSERHWYELFTDLLLLPPVQVSETVTDEETDQDVEELLNDAPGG